MISKVLIIYHPHAFIPKISHKVCSYNLKKVFWVNRKKSSLTGSFWKKITLLIDFYDFIRIVVHNYQYFRLSLVVHPWSPFVEVVHQQLRIFQRHVTVCLGYHGTWARIWVVIWVETIKLHCICTSYVFVNSRWCQTVQIHIQHRWLTLCGCLPW